MNMTINLSPKKLKYKNFFFNLKIINSIEEVMQLSKNRTYDFFYDSVCRPIFCNLGCWVWETDDVDIVINPFIENNKFCHFETFWINRKNEVVKYILSNTNCFEQVLSDIENYENQYYQ